MKLGVKGLVSVLIAASALVLAGCGEKAVDNNKLKVGVIAGAEAQVAEIAAKVAKEKYNLDVELITFTDYITPNAALDDGSIEVNAFQHKPYLDQQILDRGYKLAVVGNTFVYPIAAYSKQITAIEQLKDGDRISLPNDPTNLGRSLLLLEQQGLITLKENAGLLASVRDIVENPKKLQFVELDAPHLPRSLDDVALAIINTTYASSLDLTPEKDGIFVEDKESPYVNLMVSRQDNVNDEKVQNFLKAYQTDAVAQGASEIFKGGAVKGW